MAEQVRSFHEMIEQDFSKLDLYTTAITRAHGKSHPEAFKVRDLFESINAKIENAGDNELDLEAEFSQLRKVTNNYTIPQGVCQTYESVYTMLAEADKSYHS